MTGTPDTFRELLALPIDRRVQVALHLLRTGKAAAVRMAVLLLRQAADDLDVRVKLRAAMPKERAGLTELQNAMQLPDSAAARDARYPPDRRYHGD